MRLRKINDAPGVLSPHMIGRRSASGSGGVVR